MSDAAMKVDPDYYNRRLLETDARVTGGGAAGGARPHPSAPPSSWGGGGGGGVGGGGGSGGLPDLPDYLVRQHSLLGLYLSLNPGDEADAERHWGFPQHQRAALVGATVVVPLLLAVFLTGSWLWKASVIAVATVGARVVLSFALATFSDIEVPFQGHVLAVWPHFTIGTLAVMALVWFVCAAASGTGWSTLWLAFTSLLLLACAEAGLRGGMWHFQWWEPATRFSFLKPWGDAYGPVATGSGRGGAGFGAPQASSYAPPRPMAAAPAQAPAPRQAEQPYRSPSGNGGSEGVAAGSVGGDGLGPGGMNGGGGPAAAAVAAAPKDESAGLLEENSKEMGDLEDIFSESV
ncbi:unnamed protein product [Ectocarpus fasciculatus]